MSNDTGKDLIPVKDVGIDKYGGLSCRSKERDFNTTSITEGSYASKLDRTELENRYLRFLEENINLKKHCHNQEEKIKRLAAKLLRVVAERNFQSKGLITSKYSDLEVEDLMTRVNELEHSNQILKEKLMVAGIQLSTHHGFVPHGIRKSPRRFGCHPTPNMSSRSEYSRDQGSNNSPGNQMSEQINNNDQHQNKYEFLEQEVCKLKKQLINYEKELKIVREQSHTRIKDLESELARVQEEGSRMAAALSAATAAAHSSARNLEQSSRRVAENIEIIRLQRHIKTQEEHICTLEAERREAMEGIQKMNELVNSLERENCELKELLSDETVKVCNLQSEVEKAMKDSTMKQLTLEELKEEINDLKVEKSIIQDANNKIVMSIMDKIIDGTQENVPAKPQVTSTETEPMANIQSTSMSSIEIKHNDNANVHTKNGINDSNKKTEENESARKEKDIERRVMELEEELNKKLETEREVQMLKSQEEQKKKEYELKLKEYEMQQEMNMAEKENLKQQVDIKEALLSKCNLKVDQLKEELKTLRFQFKELECTNLKMSEKLTSKDVEIQGLQEVQKELTKKIESQLLEEIQGDNEEEKKELSISSSDDEKHESEDLKEEISAIHDEDLKADSMHLKLTEMSEQYEKAQELLQEKEAAINVYKLEVDKLICDLDSMKLQNESLLLNLEEKEEQNRLLSMKEESERHQPVSKLSPDPDKCIFEIHMDSILVSDEGVATLRRIGEQSSSPAPNIFITWVFFEQEAAYSPLCQGPDAQLNCSYDHVIPIKPGLFDYLDEETLVVEVHAAVEDMSIPIAQGIISFKECLSYPLKMISQSVRLISLSDECNNKGKERRNSARDFTESPMEEHEFGILQYRFQINCDRQCVDYYKKKKMKEKSKIESICNDAQKASPIKEDISKFTKKFIEKTKKKSLKSKSVDNNFERFGEHNMESEDVITLPKPAPRSLKKSSPVESPKPQENNSMLSPPQISIEVHSLWIVPECSVANDPNIHQLFVEYSFLGKGGENLETPVSLPKNQENEKLNFNFKRVFSMDPIKNLMERNILRNMIYMKSKGRNKSPSLLAKGKVRFNVVSEPLSDDDSNAECIDVGYADINIPKILLDGHDMVEDDIPVMNSNGTNEVIGFLNISFLAYDVLKTLCDHPVR